MPNTFIDNRDAWLRMSDIDYLGQFVKAWLAFNAWYRSAYSEPHDRTIINEFKWQPNPVRNKLCPLLLNSQLEDAEQFRSEIALLHTRLENYELHEGKGDQKRRISLTNIYLKDNPANIRTETHWRKTFSVERNANRQIRVEVREHPSNALVFNIPYHNFDVAFLDANTDFQQKLTTNLQGYLRQIYQAHTPVNRMNLTTGSEIPIRCGAFEFCCGREALYAGVVEAVYLMRCTLFHGELVPTKDAVSCYEPAFRIVRRFLDCVV